MRLSIVIPTRERESTLARTLATIGERWTEAGDAEIVVVEDGEPALAGEAVAAAIEAGVPAARLRTLATGAARRGPAAARNVGVAYAAGERVLLLGDDTAPAPGGLAAHRESATGLQGEIAWDPRRPVTPLMRFLAPEGPQFWFRGLVDGGALPFTALLGSNYSAPRAWLVAEPYDESFPDAAWEDTELAWRFRERGFASRFSRRALAWHDHRYDELAPFLARQRRAGRSARRAVALHPALAWWALLRPLAVHAVKAALPTRANRRVEPERGWDVACRRAYLAGFFTPSRTERVA